MVMAEEPALHEPSTQAHELDGVHWRASAGDEKASVARTIRMSRMIPHPPFESYGIKQTQGSDHGVHDSPTWKGSRLLPRPLKASGQSG